MTRLAIRIVAVWIVFSLISTVSWATDIQRDTRYLALGDSVAFGYNPLVVPVNLSEYTGYPDLVSKLIHRKVANASCFGESSGSFLSLTAPDTGCHLWRANFPLYVSYAGTQMQYALDYLKANAKKTDLITIDIGANDLGVLLAECQGDLQCAVSGLPAVLATYATNLTTIFADIRQAGYFGPIVAVTSYAANYADATEVTGLTSLNAVLIGLAPAFDVTIADAFTAFLAADTTFAGDSCAAGLLIRLPNGTCDIHPSLAGQALIAQTVVDQIPKH